MNSMIRKRSAVGALVALAAFSGTAVAVPPTPEQAVAATVGQYEDLRAWSGGNIMAFPVSGCARVKASVPKGAVYVECSGNTYYRGRPRGGVLKGAVAFERIVDMNHRVSGVVPGGLDLTYSGLDTGRRKVIPHVQRQTYFVQTIDTYSSKGHAPIGVRCRPIRGKAGKFSCKWRTTPKASDSCPVSVPVQLGRDGSVLFLRYPRTVCRSSSKPFNPDDIPNLYPEVIPPTSV